MRDKLKFIKDPIWGNIQMFVWEDKLLQNFLYNRLHNIVQNSSAYKVYPGLKYSRFIHSIGVAHVAGQLAINAFSKTTKAEAIIAISEEAKKLEVLFSNDALNEIRKVVGGCTICPNEFSVLVAAVRMTALIHDIGHLPFSHVLENALDGFLEGKIDDINFLRKESNLG